MKRKDRQSHRFVRQHQPSLMVTCRLALESQSVLRYHLHLKTKNELQCCYLLLWPIL